MKIRVVRVRSRDTLIRPEVVDLIKRAVAATQYPGLEWPMLAAELVRRIVDPGLGLFLSFEESEVMQHTGISKSQLHNASPPERAVSVPRGLALAILPDSALMIAGQVALAYNEGSRDAAKALAKAVRKWMGDNGQTIVLCANLRHKDAVFARGLRYFGRPQKVASLFIFRIDGRDEDLVL